MSKLSKKQRVAITVGSFLTGLLIGKKINQKTTDDSIRESIAFLDIAYAKNISAGEFIISSLPLEQKMIKLYEEVRDEINNDYKKYIIFEKKSGDNFFEIRARKYKVDKILLALGGAFEKIGKKELESLGMGLFLGTDKTKKDIENKKTIRRNIEVWGVGFPMEWTSEFFDEAEAIYFT